MDFGLILGGFWEPRAVILGIDFLMIFACRPKSGPRAPKRPFGVVFGWSGGGLGASWGGLRVVLGRLGVVLGRSVGDLGVVLGHLGVYGGGFEENFNMFFTENCVFLVNN